MQPRPFQGLLPFSHAKIRLFSSTCYPLTATCSLASLQPRPPLPIYSPFSYIMNMKHAGNILLLVLLLTSLRVSAQIITDNPSMLLEVTSSHNAAPADSLVTITLKFRPSPDIHMPKEPGVSIAIDSGSCLRVLSPLQQPIDSGTGYLNVNEPMSVDCVILPSTPAGHAVAGAVITYYFCSDSEGWCKKWSQHVSLAVTAQTGHSRSAASRKSEVQK